MHVGRCLETFTSKSAIAFSFIFDLFNDKYLKVCPLDVIDKHKLFIEVGGANYSTAS